MKTLSALVLLSLTSLAAQIPTSPATEVAAIEGIVVRAGGPQTLAGARISLERIEPGAAENEVVTPVATDEAGRFRIDGVRPGQYRIFADLEGYVRSEYGQRAPGSTGTAVLVRAGEVFSTRLDMSPGGVISGRVYDESGEPVVGAIMSIEVPQYARGYRIVAPPRPSLPRSQVPFALPVTSSTNDLGQYRISGLAPGEYYISARKSVPPPLDSVADLSQASAQPGFPPVLVGGVTGTAGSSAPEAFRSSSAPVTVYYPGTDSSRDAQPVLVRAASETGGVNILWGTGLPLVTISGVVEGMPAPPTVPEGVPFRLTPQIEVSGLNGEPVQPSGMSMSGSGAFSVRVGGLRSYIVRAEARTGTRSVEYSGQVRVEAGDQDVGGVTIPLRPPIGRIPGQVRLASPGGDVDLQSLSVRLEFGVLPGTSSSGGRSTRVEADGSFELSDVALRDYVLSLTSRDESAGIYVESARYGIEDPVSGWFTPVDDPQRRLEIVVGSTPGELTGRVLGTEGPYPGALVTLVPDGDRVGRSDLYQSIPTDPDGEFHFEQVPPGRYRLFAWNQIPDGAVENADFMLPYRGRGEPVTVEPNLSADVELRLILR